MAAAETMTSRRPSCADFFDAATTPERNTNVLNKKQLALLLVCPSLAFAQSLTLLCDGQGTVMTTQSTTVNQYDFKHNENKIGVAQTQVRRPFSGNGTVEISSGTGRMRIPDPMIPALMSGDSNGWYPIENIFINDREISGVVHINFLSQPKLRIDRMTGKLSMSGGAGDFSADCSAADNSKPKF
jgi:hypothetical protein